MFVRSCPFQDTLHGGFLESGVSDTRSLIFVHISSLSADVGFVRFNSAGGFSRDSFLHRKANALQHEPCCFLGDAETAVKFVRTNPVLAVSGQPHSRKPLVQANGRVLKDRSDLNGKFLFRVGVLAFPQFCVLKKSNFLGTTLRTSDATRPAERDQELQTGLRIAEISNRFKKRFRCFHTLNLAP